MYSGEWCEGMKEGEGEMVWGGGRERYNGHWVNDSPNGHGMYVWQSSSSQNHAQVALLSEWFSVCICSMEGTRGRVEPLSLSL